MAGYLGHNPVRRNYVVDEFTTTAPQASSGNFILSQTISDSKFLEVSVGGIDQPQSAYSVTGTTLAFGASVIAQNDIVIVRHAGESIMYPTLEDGTVTSSKMESAFLATLITSPEIYGFSVNANGHLIVTTTNSGADNITSTTFDTFADAVFAVPGFTWSLVGTQLRCTI